MCYPRLTMQMRFLLVAVFIGVISCSPRGELVYAPEPTANVRQVFVGSTRGLDPETGAAHLLLDGRPLAVVQNGAMLTTDAIRLTAERDQDQDLRGLKD